MKLIRLSLPPSLSLSLSLSLSVDLRFIYLLGQPKAYLYHSSHRKSTEGSMIGTLEFITLDHVRTTKVFM